MDFKKVVAIVLCLGLALAFTPKASAGEIDALLEKLVAKGIISQSEANQVLADTKADVKREIKAVKHPTLPKWVQKMKLKGDFRLRHQYERTSSDTEALNRGRYRLRLGVETTVVDKVKVAFGLATGGDDPKSTNQTFALAQNTSTSPTAAKSFATPDLRLDYAFAEYAPLDRLKIVGGKFKMKPYLWHATDLLWDSDIRPEGTSFNWKDDLLDIANTKYWVNGGIWVLEHNDNPIDKPDPFLKYLQLGLKHKRTILDKDVDTKAAFTYYDFQGLNDNSLTDSEGQNTTSPGDGLLVSNFDSIALSTEVGVKKLFGGLPFGADNRIAIFADFIENFDDDHPLVGKTTGWAFGAKLGHKKVKDKNQWQFKYIKAVLGEDAWVDAFPDADRGFGGETNVLSHEFIFNYGLAKNVTLGLDYYKNVRYSKALSGETDGNTEHIIQADLIFKF
jgi:hypothetical protein